MIAHYLRLSNSLTILLGSYPAASETTGYLLSRGSLERMEEVSLRLIWLVVTALPPVRALSSSELNCIQLSTRITRCGVLSLKKSGDRKNNSTVRDMGYPVNSMTTAVIFAMGSMISARQFETLLGGKSIPKMVEDVRRTLL